LRQLYHGLSANAEFNNKLLANYSGRQSDS